jgi:iron complex outermembrane receptor protein
MTMFRTGLSALLFTASAFALAPAALAQEADAARADEGRRLGAVTVTAQRREETLLDVPLAVTALDGALLETLGVADITEVAKSAPNVTLEVSRGTNTTLTAFIRGVGQQDPVAGFEAGVGLYIDDVYLNRPQGAVLDVYDVERIEVLRGPQGTLYGRNTIGGAIKYVTRRLSDEPTFKARLALGSYSQVDGLVSGSIPLGDSLRVGGSLARLTRDGFGENLINGEDNYNKDVLAARVSAELDVSESFDVRFAADYTKDDSNARQGHRLIPDLFAPIEFPVLDDVYDTRAGLNVVQQEVESFGGALTAEFRINDAFTLKNIVAYREDESTSPIDFDSLPSADLDVPAIYENEQFSNETLLSYSGDRFNGVFGAYYLDANASTVFDVLLANTGALIGLPGLNAQTFGDVGTNTWAVFGDVSFDLTEQFTLTLGGRYTEDERTSIVLRRTFIGGFSPFFGGAGTPIATTSNFNGSATYDDFTPKVVIAYQPNADHNFYASYTEGFKGGSFDPRGQTTAAPDVNRDGIRSAQEIFDFMQFDPETVQSYEVGWKASFDRATTNLAVFFADYTDVQIPGSVGVDTNNDGINDTFTGVTTNAASADLFGVEFEGLASLADGLLASQDNLSATWAVGYIDASFNTFIDAFGRDVASQRVFQNTPEWTASTRLTYTNPLKLYAHEGLFTAALGYSWRSEASQFEVPNAFLDQEAFGLLDFTLNWRQDDGPFTLSLIGKNLTDERYKVAGYNFVNINANGTFISTLGQEGTLTAFFGDPRTVTFAIGMEF